MLNIIIYFITTCIVSLVTLSLMVITWSVPSLALSLIITHGSTQGSTWQGPTGGVHLLAAFAWLVIPMVAWELYRPSDKPNSNKGTERVIHKALIIGAKVSLWVIILAVPLEVVSWAWFGGVVYP